MTLKYANFPAQRYLSRAVPDTTIQYRHAQCDLNEQMEVVYKLNQRGEELSPSQAINLKGSVISLESGSTLDDALQPGRDLLQKMSEQNSFKNLMATFNIPEHSLFEVTSEGEVNARYSGKTVGFANAFKLAPDLTDDLHALVEMAQLTGGVISLADHVELAQWLKFHGYIIPRTAAEGSRLTKFMELKPPVSPPLGNYWEMIKDGGDNSVTLSAVQRSEFRKLITSYIKDQSLLEHLVNSILGGRSTPFKRSEAERVLEKLVSSPIAFDWANAYVRDLGWYGAQENQPQSDESLKQIMLTSLLLDLHPGVGEQEPRNHVAGFNLYAVEHMEKSFADIQTEFERHLIENHRITERNAALAAHLLLAEAAPEFLLRDLPSTLLLGTPQWVEFCRIVSVHEIIAPGSTRSMTYAELHHMSKFDSVSESRKTLDALAAVDPVIDWGLLNKIITPDDVEKSVTDSLEVALGAYARHAKTLAETAETLSRPLPTRKSVALDMLKQVAKGCTYLESDVLHQRKNRPLEDAYANPFPVSPVELHMSNDLRTGDWDLKNGESIYKAFPKMLPNLIPPDGEFHRQFNRDYVTHVKAMNMHLKQAFSSMPLPDRTRLLKGKVTMFTVRPPVAKLHSITSLPTNPIASTIETVLKVTGRKPTESHKDIDEAKGRYGVVICSHYEGRVTCYELFTLHGTCRENTRLAGLIQEENLLNTTVRSSEIKNYSPPAKVLQLPTDIECYTHGVTPGLVNVSPGVIEKLGELSAPPPALGINGYYQSFYSTEFDPLVNFVLKHRPVATFDELVKECWGQTKLEALRAKREKDLDTFLNFVVPFKSCIEDLNSDDLDRQFQGVAACTLEATMTVLLVVGAVAQIASLAAKSMSLATKAGKFASTGLGLVGSLINPLDGASDLFLHGAKLLRKTWRNSVVALDNAIVDARKWAGVTPHSQLAATVDPDTIRLGTWRPAQTSQDVFQVWGIRHNDEWYALNRLGQPWGAKLENFNYKFKLPTLPWHRIMPKSYTQRYIKKAIPAAKAKLDRAIHLLADIESDNEVRKVLNYLFGTGSDEAAQHIGLKLRAIRKDLDAFTLTNVSFRKADVSAVAALDVPDYKRWKQAVTNGTAHKESIKRFIKIYPEHLDDFFRTTKYDESRIADVLIHEMSHGAPGTLDLYYGKTLNRVEFDAAPLIDLARNPRMVDPSFSNPYKTVDTQKFTHLHQFESIRPSLPTLVQKHPALYNADSYEVAVSLIDQIKSDPAGFAKNMTTIETALNNTAADQFLGSLEINLGRGSS
ncbi:hypothetical protein [Pseudomonas sp. BGI-2]|uniref:hypothetical protein n=1 Tax=Pseudomonas sp. BGI-2 TaxID=2528211 RepID=UPI0021156AA3|nr:hypothetical protein [Pseudomonas sp. BGI-2]